MFETDPATGKQFRVSVCDEHFGGSFDGVGRGFIEAPKTWHLIEMKTHNEKSFNQLVKKGVQEAKPEHFVQMQVYMYLATPQLTRAFYIAVNKNTDELYGERIRLDPAVGKAAIERASGIIASDRPLNKISDDPTWYLCKFCDHHALCHGEQPPEVNCRTCLHSTPLKNGQWHCARHHREMSETEQTAGCEQHLYNPYLLETFAEPLDSGEYWIRYQLKSTGEVFITGDEKGQFSSAEIQAVTDKRLLTDKKLAALKKRFDGTLIKEQTEKGNTSHGL